MKQLQYQKSFWSLEAVKLSIITCKGLILGLCNQTKSTPANIDDSTNNLWKYILSPQQDRSVVALWPQSWWINWKYLLAWLFFLSQMATGPSMTSISKPALMSVRCRSQREIDPLSIYPRSASKLMEGGGQQQQIMLFCSLLFIPLYSQCGGGACCKYAMPPLKCIHIEKTCLLYNLIDFNLQTQWAIWTQDLYLLMKGHCTPK